LLMLLLLLTATTTRTTTTTVVVEAFSSSSSLSPRSARAGWRGGLSPGGGNALVAPPKLSPSVPQRTSSMVVRTAAAVDSPDDDDDGDEKKKKKKTTGVLRSAAAKFKARPGTYLAIPFIAAFVGWFTNYLAVQMIFYPVRFRGIPIYRRPEVPLGLIGWQGIVPCKTVTMSKALVEMVTSQLLTVPEAFERMNPKIVARHLAGAVPQLGADVIGDVAGTAAAAAGSSPLNLWKAVFGGGWHAGIVNWFNVRVLKGVVKDLVANSERIFSLENCVVDQMVLDRSKLGQLFQKVGRVELDFLTNSGLWFGFLLGLIQMAVALVWENPWALSIGGTIVGLATNWLALKWIFEPVYPTKIGPFLVQGMFLKRQKEVAAEFSKFFASRIVTSEQIWNTVLTDPSTKPALHEVLGGHVRRLLGFAALGGLFSRFGGPSLPSAATVGKVTGSAVSRLGGHLTKGLHGYVDGALKLEDTLRVQMEAMSPAKFERVLHPIFEEDELTLIIAGGVLGFVAGLIQQGLETGDLTIPPLPAPIAAFLAAMKRRIGSAFGRSGKAKTEDDDDSDSIGGNDDGVSGE